jgi:predicted ribosome quality control (RQC) complex YloA/Tae2 family protein
MNISLPDLQAVCLEVSEALAGGVVQEVRQPTATAVVLGMRGTGGTFLLLLEVRPRLARVHLVSRRPGTLNPPPAFVCKLRADIAGARLSEVEMPWDDRVALLRFARSDHERVLVAELTGHHANLFLTDSDLRILVALRPSASHQRDLSVGQRYVPPLLPDRAADAGHQAAALPDRAADAGHQAAGLLEPAGASARLEAHYARLEAAVRLADERARVASIVGARLKKVRGTLERVQGDLNRLEQCEECRKHGDLVKANFANLQRGMTRATLQDWTVDPPEPVEVKLRADLGPRENAAWLFERYKKARRGLPVVRQRIEELSTRERELAGIAAALAGAGTVEELAALASAAGSRGKSAAASGGDARESGSRRTSGRAVHVPYREYVSSGGKRVLVGKGGRDNQALTFKVASPHDGWLHVRGFSGSHVVVRLARGQEMDRETLLDAAHLAVQFSKAPKAGFVEVMWTLRKHVRAVKGGPPGQVTVARDHNLAFDFDAARARRLTAHREEGTAG